MKAVHQLIAAASPGDAVTGQALAWQQLFRSEGRRSEIVAEHVHPGLSGAVVPLAHASQGLLREGAVVLRYSLWSRVVPAALGAGMPLALVYHNITPGELLRSFDPALADLCDEARRQLPHVATAADVVVADSTFNARELEEAGVRKPMVIPLLLAVAEPRPPKPVAADPVILAVGRIATSKRLEHVIHAFALYQQRARSASLVLVGSASGFELYREVLCQLATELGAKQVEFTGQLSDEARDEWYRSADAYISLSAHEGFCAPIVEALVHGVPVIASPSGAIPETLGGAGLLLEAEHAALVAEALHEVTSRPETRQGLHALARERLRAFRVEAVADRVRQAMAPLLAE